MKRLVAPLKISERRFGFLNFFQAPCSINRFDYEQNVELLKHELKLCVITILFMLIS